MKPLNRQSRHRRRGPAATYEALNTLELLSLHERHFGALDPKARVRILEITRARGWADGWLGLDGLAA
jgi:hypothetical protein